MSTPPTLLELIAREYDLKAGEHLVLCDAGKADDLFLLIESTHPADRMQAYCVIDLCFKWRNDRKTI